MHEAGSSGKFPWKTESTLPKWKGLRNKSGRKGQKFAAHRMSQSASSWVKRKESPDGNEKNDPLGLRRKGTWGEAQVKFEENLEQDHTKRGSSLVGLLLLLPMVVGRGKRA